MTSWRSAIVTMSLDLGTCFLTGGETQAVRVDPAGGSSALNLTRLTFVLHGAVC